MNMKVLLLLGVAGFFSLISADKDGRHDQKCRHNESLAYTKLAPYTSKFSFDLYRQIAGDHPHENIVFSPVSISTAFALLSLGAKAQTRSQIMEGLGFNTSEISEAEVHQGFHHLLGLLNDTDRELSGGSALFISREHKILQTFLDEALRFYHSEVFSTDFKNKEAKNQINRYVERKTGGKIANLLGSVDQDAMLVLINYIYFRGKWVKPFNEKWTKEEDFHVNESTTVTVPFMTREGWHNVAFTDDATVVSLPYKGDASVLFILPKEGKFSEVEQNFNEESIMKWKKSLSRKVVDLSLPKFTVSSAINLKETLNKLGAEDVFSDNADLSGITGGANINVSKAIHQAVLSVDERGTEAGGSTSLDLVPLMLPPCVKFNRPFMFSLYDHKTTSLLFAGRITRPQR